MTIYMYTKFQVHETRIANYQIWVVNHTVREMFPSSSVVHHKHILSTAFWYLELRHEICSFSMDQYQCCITTVNILPWILFGILCSLSGPYMVIQRQIYTLTYLEAFSYLGFPLLSTNASRESKHLTLLCAPFWNIWSRQLFIFEAELYLGSDRDRQEADLRAESIML